MAVSLQVLLLSALLPVISPLDSCPTFGSQADLFRKASLSSGLLLNFADTAQCNGTVTGWSYCFYRPQEVSDEPFAANFVVFRQDPSDPAMYSAVEGSMYSVEMSYSDVSSSTSCRTITLSEGDQFRIEQNDVIGACFYAENHQPLVIASELSSNNRHVYISQDSNFGDCREASFRSVDVTQNFNDRDWAVHLTAEVDTSEASSCGIGNKLSSLTPYPWLQTGTYLDIHHQSTCSGDVTEWQICYYTASTTPGSFYKVDIGIWSWESDLNEYSMLENSSRVISVQIPESDNNIPVPAISCVTKQVKPVSISSGDVAGILWTQDTNMLPIVAFSEGQNSQLLEFSSNRTMESMALHLYATVQGGDDPRSHSGGFPAGSIAAIVVVMLLVLTGGVAAVVLLGVLYWRRRGYKGIVKSESSGSSQLEVGASSSVRKQGPILPVKSVPARSVPVKSLKPHPPLASTAVLERRHDTMEVGGYDVSVDYCQKSKRSFARNEREGSSEAVYADLLKKNMRQDIYNGIDHYTNPATNKIALYAQLKACGVTTIKRKFIQMRNHLGSGQFGSVALGTWDNGGKKLDVALKMLNKGSSVQDTVKFLQEAAIMAQFHHPNVIKLYGVNNGEPIILVVELADSDLLNHLEQVENRLRSAEVSSDTVADQLLKFSQQVGLGMQYLSAKGFVHRDLAARNILVKNNKICKIADFGMSRDLAQEEVYISSGGKIPLKWTAPEAVHFRKYSTASDVWSYGCVLYEIWSLGQKPFGEERNLEVVRLVRSGFRLPPPPGCPKALYQIMINTWNPEPESRPNFRDIVLQLVGSREQVLAIPYSDLHSHHSAGTLGAELEAGLHMYRELQDIYMHR